MHNKEEYVLVCERTVISKSPKDTIKNDLQKLTAENK